ncbi:MAG: glycosyltransferase family 4 protein [Actinobacteria bacterium]|nr:MAG: glycosyltransferase family 4 protein [Actinomycetota bacterium]
MRPLRLRRRRGGGPIAPEVVPRALLEWRREGTASPASAGGGAGERLRVAIVVPAFRRGSGGHQTIVHLARGLAQRGHDVSLWLEDDEGRHEDSEAPAHFAEFFGWRGLRPAFAGWDGCDVAVATGWQTVHRVLRLPRCGARAYLVQDHEPEFYATSASRTWAEQTYGLGLHCIAASRWLAGLLRERYGASASHFDLAVDHEIYRADGAGERDGSVLFYARATTPRRAVPLGLLALEELTRRRPGVPLALFGEPGPVRAAFAHRSLGVLEGRELAEAYRRASVGLVLSMTNISLVPLGMAACGLPCVELDTDCLRAEVGGALELAAFDPIAVADALERLLDDAELRARRARKGLAFVAERRWERAAGQVEAGLREALVA